MIITFRYRVKDGSQRKHLSRLATACNQVWNFCCATQRESESRWKQGRVAKWKTHFDLINLITGCAAELGIHSDSASAICGAFAKSRDKIKHAPKFRASFGSKRALGWIPMVPRAFKLTPGAITYKGRTFHFWQSRPIDGVIKTAQLVENASGKWFVCFSAEVENKPSSGVGEVGIDLGLKTLATMSDGGKIDIQRTYRRFEPMLAIQQRAGNKNRVRAIHRKIADIRKDFLHKAANAIVAANSVIYVGDVNAAKLAKTSMAKSVLDAGWSMFRNMLAYKSSRAQVHFAVVNERMTSQVCSECGCLPLSRPRGIADLDKRHWICSDCGSELDRDVNAARNILRRGREHSPLVAEIPVL